MAPPRRGKKGEGFHSAAGLIRYFDAEEESAIKINPYMVIGMGIIMIAVIAVANWLWPI